MIKTEFYKTRNDGVNLYKTYSDNNVMILQEQTGHKYTEAIDVEGSSFTYVETEEPIPEKIEKPLSPREMMERMKKNKKRRDEQ